MSIGKEIIDGVSNIVKDRVGHPFLGSFIFTFLTINYDILIDLAVNIQDPLAVLIFKSFLYGEMSLRLGVPALMMISFPLFIQNGSDIVYNYFKEKTNKRIENRKEKERREILVNKIDFVNSQLYDLREDNKARFEKTTKVFDSLLKLVKGYAKIHYLSIFESEIVLVKGEFVSLLADETKITFYDKKLMFLGRVFEKINDQLYIIEVMDNNVLKEFLRINLDSSVYEGGFPKTFVEVKRNGEFEFYHQNIGSNQIIASSNFRSNVYSVEFTQSPHTDLLNSPHLFWDKLLSQGKFKKKPRKGRIYYLKAFFQGSEPD
ncbi:hypothetical protein CH369_17955 [Leptospira levettii]|uniref:hypothetical protein n=1 Tax=Leptospira levettii TaxID=2023178 RepID=UPI000C2AE9D2|nr:hypothetical protein [Leptospira levettii]PJZ98849.1 hypothetical protein CH369_17955 [Leptospira levettii]